MKIFQDLSVRTQNAHRQTDVSVRAQIGYGRTSSYQGYYWTPKMGQNSMISLFFCKRAKKASAEGQSPLQELEVGPRSRPSERAFEKTTQKCFCLHFANYNFTIIFWHFLFSFKKVISCLKSFLNLCDEYNFFEYQ